MSTEAIISAWSDRAKKAGTGRIHAVAPTDPEKTLCGRSHVGAWSPPIEFGGAVVQFNNPYVCRDCVRIVHSRS